MNGKEMLKNIDALWVAMSSRRDEIATLKNLTDQIMGVVVANGKRVDELAREISLHTPVVIKEGGLAVGDKTTLVTFGDGEPEVFSVKQAKLKVAEMLYKKIMSGKYDYDELALFIELTEGM